MLTVASISEPRELVSIRLKKPVEQKKYPQHQAM